MKTSGPHAPRSSHFYLVHPAWDGRRNLDNTPNDITFVLGGHRVIYNASALFAGSPYIAPGFSSPAGNRCGYSLTFPPDDPFLGGADLVLDWPGGHGNENTAIQEQMAYWLADRMGLPFSYRYFIRLQVNGVTDLQRGGVFEAVLQPAGDFLKQWSPEDSDGDFYKIDRAFEFSDGGSLIADPMPRLQVFKTPNLADGGTMKKTERYRWTWLKRSYDTANNYTNIFALVDALNAVSPEAYTAATESLVDVEEWMGIFAFEHIINNFDSWGHVIGKNMYAYKPRNGRWQLYAFDLDWLMLVSTRYSAEYTAASGPLFNSDDPTVTRLYNHPPFRRAYYRAVQAAVDGLASFQCDPVMDAKYASLVANGVTLCDGSALANPAAVKTWFRDRRTALQNQLAAVNVGFAIAGSPNLNTSSNLVTLTGAAPISLTTLTINGSAWPITWTTVTNWIVRLPVDPGTNRLAILGFDRDGNAVPGASRELTVVFPGNAPSPQGLVFINEIQFNPAVPEAEYVELFNASSEFSFDLSGWVFNGLGYTFPAGSFIAPRSFLVLAKDPVAFTVAYGASALMFDQFPGNLQADGETLTLMAPGLRPADDLIVDEVRYGASMPWPAPVIGASLQLIDPGQDNRRVANWGVSESSTPSLSLKWVRVTATGTASSSRLYLYLQSDGDIYIDDVVVVAGSAPETGANLVVNGDFNAPLSGTWTATANFAQSALSTSVKHSGASSLHLIATAGGSGSGSGNAVYQDLVPALSTGASYALSFWYLQTTNGGPLTVRLSGSGLNASVDPAPDPATAADLATPGRANSLQAALPAFPTVWLNEVQPVNLSGITDRADEHEPWIEVYNAGTNLVALDGLYLADNHTNLAPWSFPPGATLAPGEFKVIFADGQPSQATATEWHTNFRLGATNGSIAFTRLNGNRLEVLDYLNYTSVRANAAYGSYPDGQPVRRFEFYTVTPGQANTLPRPALPVMINEWMASNTGFILDPAGNAADDWFELYNPNTLPVDLSGYSLTDNTNQWRQSIIPAGTQIPARGFLLFWADGHPERNAPGQEVHTDFQLDKEGDDIALYSPLGELMDRVSFGAQTSNQSLGRYPDGAALIAPMNLPTPRMPNRREPDAVAPHLTIAWNREWLTVSWSSAVGKIYQLQHKDRLETPAWNVVGNYPATGTVHAVNLSLGPVAEGFYRVVVLP